MSKPRRRTPPARDAAQAQAGADSARPTHRVQLELLPQTMERLARLKERIEATSHAEMIRSALRLFELLLEEHKKGAGFALKRPDGKLVAYKIFL